MNASAKPAKKIPPRKKPEVESPAVSPAGAQSGFTGLSPATVAGLRAMSLPDVLRFYEEYEAAWKKAGKSKPQLVRAMCLADLFYLLVVACRRLDMLHPWVYARVREVEANPDNYLDLWARGHFKDLADSTPMLTENRGWTTHGELHSGDIVFSPTGTPVEVLAVTPQFVTSKCYRLTFRGGESIIAGAGHQWRLRKKIKRRISGSNQRFVEFSEFTLNTEQMISRGGRLDVGTCAPLQFPVAQLPLHPYLVGCWLGDGTSSCGGITGIDQEIFDRISSLGYRVSKPKGMHVTVYGIMPILRSIGILNAKAIPSEYMRASVVQRMELLRGLMDTDGTCDKSGTATFCNSKENLARQVYELANGLGLQAKIRQYSFKSDVAKARNGRYWFWQVSFQAHSDRNPFFLERKAARAIKPSHYRGCRTISRIEPIESVPTRCIQVEGGVYVAGRELVPTHNSSTITFALTIQDILKDPEITFGIFSHTRPIAKAFLRQIMRELEGNRVLHAAFPDVLWGTDTRSAPKWSEDDGIIVRRKSNPPEATIEAWGLIDGQPTSKHFKRLLYDDIVVEASVNTPEMIEKTMKALEQSYNLSNESFRRRFCGTRWHFNDAYKTITDRGTVRVRTYPGTDDGTETGTPVFWSADMLAEKRRDMGPYTFAAQILLNPKADALQGFKREWLRYYDNLRPRGMNGYILVDAANEKRKESDYTCMWAVLLGTDQNYYAYLIVRDRLNLTERTSRLFDMHRKLRKDGVNIVQVRYERYGIMADIAHIKAEQEAQNYRFDITEVGGMTPKGDRIKRLLPIFEQGRFYLMRSLHVTDYQKMTRDLVNDFIEDEYMAFPVSAHKDMLDSLSRIAEPDLKLVWPKESKKPVESRELAVGSWMT